ncbi:GNAT family N-acetyltransferase [Motilibacter sp. K478]|nr:GNAT family N-acetyltransferase [Motilibacter aurantiacus]
MDTADATAVLDDPVGASLRGRHAHLARGRGRVAAYVPEVATFVAVPPDPRPGDWADLAGLLGGGGLADLFSCPATPPAGWAPEFAVPGVQMVAAPGSFDRSAADADGIAELGPADVPDMLELVGRTRPGPFWPRTVELGGYLGVRDRGRLVAMCGERLRPPGWAEISAVCTAPEARGRGLAARLVSEAASRVVARGERPFLHVAGDNTGAVTLYRRLGFRTRREVTFRGFRVSA